MDSLAAGLTREPPRPQPFLSASLGSGAAPSPCSVSLAHTRGQFSHGMGSAGLKKPSLSQDDEGLPPPAVLSSETPVAPAPAPRPAALLHVSACSTEAVPGLHSRQSLPECHWQQHVFNDRALAKLPSKCPPLASTRNMQPSSHWEFFWDCADLSLSRD